MRYTQFLSANVLPVGALLMACAALVSFAVGGQLLSRDAARNTEQMLKQTADAASTEVAQWVDGQFRTLTTLANNPALPLYFMGAQQRSTAPATEAASSSAAQADYLARMLRFTAEQWGALPKQGVATASADKGMLALLDAKGSAVKTAGDASLLNDTATTLLKAAPMNSPSLIDLGAAPSGGSWVAFVVPVYSVQADRATDAPMARVVAITALEQAIAQRLAPLSESNADLKIAILRASENGQQTLSGNAPGNNAMAQQRAVKGTEWNVVAHAEPTGAVASVEAATQALAVITCIMLLSGLTMLLAQYTLTHRQRLATMHAPDESLMAQIAAEREKRMRTLSQLVEMLVSLVDGRDPHAAQHSAYVAHLAAATAHRLGLDAHTIETTETAARLLNIGKVEVPEALLTKTSALNEEERLVIRSSLATSAALLDGIDFIGPVAETLRQTQERMDGSGPQRLKGESILISARIVAAANAVVGMVSPRSYRPAMGLAQAIEIVRGDAGAHFDPKVVEALCDYLMQEGKDLLEPLITRDVRHRA